MKVKFWLTVLPGAVGLYGGGKLWTKLITTSALPQRGDWVYTCIDITEDSDGTCAGFRLEPKQRYMDALGEWNVELQKVVLDPPEEVLRQIQADDARGHQGYAVEWLGPDRTVQTIETQLRGSGWREYS